MGAMDRSSWAGASESRQLPWKREVPARWWFTGSRSAFLAPAHETVPTTIGAGERNLGNVRDSRGVSWVGREGPLPIPCLNLELQLAEDAGAWSVVSLGWPALSAGGGASLLKPGRKPSPRPSRSWRASAPRQLSAPQIREAGKSASLSRRSPRQTR